MHRALDEPQDFVAFGRLLERDSGRSRDKWISPRIFRWKVSVYFYTVFAISSLASTFALIVIETNSVGAGWSILQAWVAYGLPSAGVAIGLAGCYYVALLMSRDEAVLHFCAFSRIQSSEPNGGGVGQLLCSRLGDLGYPCDYSRERIEYNAFLVASGLVRIPSLGFVVTVFSSNQSFRYTWIGLMPMFNSQPFDGRSARLAMSLVNRAIAQSPS